MTRIRKLRALATQASGYAKPGRCATCIIGLCHGPWHDPYYRIRAEVLMTWLNYWHYAYRLRDDMRDAWNYYVRDGRVSDGNHWSRVRGPIGVVVATLIDFEWTPTAPDRFIADNEQVYRMAANGDGTCFKQMLLESAQWQAWKMASVHTGHPPCLPLG